MQRVDDRLVLSASDVVGFLACPHLTTLDREAAAGTRAAATRDDAEMAVLFRRGREHEAAYLEQLRQDGLAVHEIGEAHEPSQLRAAEQATRAAMADGVDVVFQATFFDEHGDGAAWRGHADFLHKVAEPSDLGAHGYEPADTKLARHVKPAAIVQLCHYAEQVTRLQGAEPAQIHVVLGGHQVRSFALRDFAAAYRQAKRRLLAAVDDPEPTYPDPVAHCAVCRWQEECDARRLADDHLTLVAGLTREQARKLADRAGITTLTDLAQVRAPLSVTGIGDGTLARLQRQARLQAGAVAGQPPPYELLAPDAEGERGLAALPEPSPGDLFFDMEGDPYVGDGGLEYLFGVGWCDGDGRWCYQGFWACDEPEERRAFEAFVDFVTARLAEDPDLHVYHYADYERTALGRLMGRHGTREDEIDALFRGRVLVDLYRVVRQSLLVGSASYSLKKLEPLFMERRDAAITDAGSSIVEFERWLQSRDRQILDDLERYNDDDCRSTMLLRDWLEARRLEAGEAFGEVPPRPAPAVAEPSSDVADDLAETAELVSALTAEADAARAAGVDVSPTAGASWLLGQLLGWHRREAKPAHWWYFHRVNDCTDADLVADSEAIGDLAYEGAVGTEAKSTIHRYRFDPDQAHKLGLGARVCDPASERIGQAGGDKPPGPGIVHQLDPATGTIDLKRGSSSTAPHPTALIPDGPPYTAAHAETLRALARSVRASGLEGDGSVQAVRDLLLRARPRVPGAGAGHPLRGSGEDSVAAAQRLADELDGGCLAIQGPPGSGKTYTAARVAVALATKGATVGVTAVSHKVIGNLLEQIAGCAAEEGASLRIRQRADPAQACAHSGVTATDNATIEREVADGDVDVVAGTSWLFARDGLREQLDYLIVDEAGQFSLADAAVVGTAARNLLLVGDPQQLAQPSQGAHPSGAAASALEHLLDGAATIPDDQGLFLDRTRRLHPRISGFVSELAYDERLKSESWCARHEIVADGTALAGSGLRWVPVPHAGNRTSSPEEVAEVASRLDALIGQQWCDANGDLRPLTLDDVLVVAPYNAQVARLAAALPDGARVGTVDKFQGQEAAVVVVSLAASSAEDVSRGLEFLYSRNRLNVAVSRAMALAVVVASPDLLNANCRTVEQLQLLNGLCRFVEHADRA